MWSAEVPPDAVTWVGVLSGGLPVAAVLLVVVWYLYKREEASRVREQELLGRIDQLQEERLKERDTLLRDVLPVLRDSGEALVRATVLWAGSNQAGGR